MLPTTSTPGLVEHRCRVCGRRLGRYTEGMPIEEIKRPVRRGSRSGTGIYFEMFDGRRYRRIICKCGRNEKQRIQLRVVPSTDFPDVVYV